MMMREAPARPRRTAAVQLQAPLRALIVGMLAMASAWLAVGCSNRDASRPVDSTSSETASRPAPVEGTLERIERTGELRAATRNAPTTYYLDRDAQPVGPEYHLLAAFAQHLGVELKLVVRETPGEVLDALAGGQADIAAAGLTETAARAAQFASGPAYGAITEQLVCLRDHARISSADELATVAISVAAGSSYVETLTGLTADVPDLTFTEVPRSSEQLLAEVAAEKVECAVADSHVVALNRRYHPQLDAKIEITGEQPLVWMHAPEADGLADALADWFADPSTRNLLDGLEERYYAFVSMFDFVELRAYQRRLETRLPQYLELFEEAAARYDLPVELLAAQAYQESQWDPDARSPTGVRGIMMLTRNTAKSLGVDNRLDPAQSIEGGAQYLARMRERFDEEIPEPDRLYLALAAYNIGRAHMHDAQMLTRQRGGDPHSWQDVKDVLPLLADKEVYRDLKYGYARGTEPVRYVERIRNYEDILRQSTVTP